ncbi:OmpA family protein [Burkholderia semiarida]|uniref:OmpA family protein n=1 Tax=Burkholderia semiarida TaxID=2843303 RepID=A0ABW7L908_9BURK
MSAGQNLGATRARHGEGGETIVKRSARRTHDHDHGGNWKVAFADFCLALMCLFLLLWVLAARDEEEARIKLIEMADRTAFDGGPGILDGAGASGGRHARIVTIDESFSAVSSRDGETGSVLVGTEASLASLAADFDRLGAEMDLQENMRAVLTPFGLRVMLHDSDARGVFERGSAVPSPPFRQLLDEMGRLFGQSGNAILVIGHTDSTPYRRFGFGGRSNWHLSTDRAMSARRSLLEGGLPPRRMLQVVGMADRAPLSDDTRAAHNRRIEFLVLTPERERMIVAMFGRPDAVVPLIPGVNVASAAAQDDEAGEPRMIPERAGSGG